MEHDGNDFTHRSGFTLNLETGQLASWSDHRDNLDSSTSREHRGLDITYEFAGPLGAEAKRRLVDESMEDLGKLVAGHETSWDGNNFVGNTEDDAQRARRHESRLASKPPATTAGAGWRRSVSATLPATTRPNSPPISTRSRS